MHNFRFNGKSCEDSLKDVKRGTRERKRTFLDNKKDSLVASHKEYIRLAGSGELNALTSEYENPGDRESHKNHDYWIAYDLFGSNLTYVDNHWKELEQLNGGRTLICPICGLADCREMDHFAPRSKFPEHSCNLQNLIPLCHNCNNDKGDSWLNEEGNQIFFNAFYDTELPDNIIKCELVQSKEDASLIRISVSFSDALLDTNPQHVRIKQTIGELRLMNRFEESADKILNIKVRDFIYRYKTESARYTDKEDFIDSSYTVIRTILEEGKTSDFIEKAVLTAIVGCDTFKDYIVALL